MKITKKGKPPWAKIWVGKCQTCGAEAEAMQSEMTRIVHDQRDGTFSWEKCPECSSGEFVANGMIFYPTKD